MLPPLLRPKPSARKNWAQLSNGKAQRRASSIAARPLEMTSIAQAQFAGQKAPRLRSGLGFRSAIAAAPLGAPVAKTNAAFSVAGRRGAVRVAAASNYSAEEFVMPWSPNLVPSGPWKSIEGCARTRY